MQNFLSFFVLDSSKEIILYNSFSLFCNMLSGEGFLENKKVSPKSFKIQDYSPFIWGATGEIYAPVRLKTYLRLDTAAFSKNLYEQNIYSKCIEEKKS